jgi:hypothetical protein
MLGVRGNNARHYDQFFTKQEVANECVKLLEDTISMKIRNFDLILEPSFGAGAFITALGLVGVDASCNKLVFVDIDACDANHRANFLTNDVVCAGALDRHSMCLTIGNPPFGKNASLAVAFFNRAALFSAVIAFVVPKTFMKASIRDRLDRHFLLATEHELHPNAFLFENKSYSVPCVFQVWINTSCLHISRGGLNCPPDALRPLTLRLSETREFVFVSASEQPDIAVRRVGVNAGRLFFDDPHQCSAESHFFIKAKEKTRLPFVKDALKSLDLENAKVKYETSGCPSISKSELCSLYMEVIHPPSRLKRTNEQMNN